jgi:hypothetical protein
VSPARCHASDVRCALGGVVPRFGSVGPVHALWSALFLRWQCLHRGGAARAEVRPISGDRRRSLCCERTSAARRSCSRPASSSESMRTAPFACFRVASPIRASSCSAGPRSSRRIMRQGIRRDKLMYKSWQVRLAADSVARIDSEPAQLRVYSGTAEVSAEGAAGMVTVQRGETLPFASVLAKEEATTPAADAFNVWAMNRSSVVSEDNSIGAEITDDPDQVDSSGDCARRLQLFSADRHSIPWYYLPVRTQFLEPLSFLGQPLSFRLSLRSFVWTVSRRNILLSAACQDFPRHRGDRAAIRFWSQAVSPAWLAADYRRSSCDTRRSSLIVIVKARSSRASSAL